MNRLKNFNLFENYNSFNSLSERHLYLKYIKSFFKESYWLYFDIDSHDDIIISYSSEITISEITNLTEALSLFKNKYEMKWTANQKRHIIRINFEKGSFSKIIKDMHVWEKAKDFNI